jgi:sulfide:quinone oxidoreductase
VISTGCVPSPERIAGLAEGGDHFYQHGPARKLADKLTRIEKGRIFITVTFPKTPNVPHQCGIAPIETTLMLDDLLRRRGVTKWRSSIPTPRYRNCCATACSFRGIPARSSPRCSSNAVYVISAGSRCRTWTRRKDRLFGRGRIRRLRHSHGHSPIRAVQAVRDSGMSQAQDGEGWLPLTTRRCKC